MIKKFLILLLISNTFSILSQETAVTFLNDLKTSSSSIKDVIPIVNHKNGDIAFFIADAKHVYGYKINSNFDVTNKTSSEQKNRKYKVLIGSSITGDDSYRVFLTNKRQDKFYTIGFNFKDGKTSSKEFVLNNRETFIQTVTHNNQFYLISGIKLNNQLFIYTFDEEGNFKKNYINTLRHNFVDSKGKKNKPFRSFNKRKYH